MNLTPYNDNFRLNGYYAQVDHEGRLIENSLEYQERQDRREKFFSILLFMVYATAVIVVVIVNERRRDFLLDTYVIDYQERKEKREAEEKKEIFNFRKYVGISK